MESSHSPSPHFRAVVVEDNPFMAKSLGLWLERKFPISLVGCAEDGEAGLRMCLEQRPDLALIDIQIPKINGLSLLGKLLLNLPQTRVIAISGLMTPFTVWSVAQSGAHGYIVKTEDLGVFAQAIHTVLDGGRFCSSSFKEVQSAWLENPETFHMIFTEREKQVLLYLMVGQDDQSIGLKLDITPEAVAQHRKTLRKKLNVETDEELLMYALRWGLDPSTVLVKRPARILVG